MKIELKKVTIREVTKNYVNNDEEGVLAHDGNLNVRPSYQREFVYKDKQRDAVINTVRNDFPLNLMYWAKNDDDSYEVLDGQQRTISICEYVAGKFSINYQYFHNLEKEEQKQILDYEMMIYLCEGDARDKLDWFKVINIAGEKLSDQELRNAIYTGEWLADAKRYFSKNGCVAHSMASDYLKGSSTRQDYLETAIRWISSDNIEGYMATRQHNKNANDLWLHFQNVINWVKVVFPNYRREMKGIDWGGLYSKHQTDDLDSGDLEVEVSRLMKDEDIKRKAGIYTYVLSKNEKHLNLRAFSKNNITEAYERQQGICVKCQTHFEINEMEADHITPWHEGGKTIPENCQMLCKHDNRVKGGG